MGVQISQDLLIKAVIGVALVLIAGMLLYHPAPTDEQVKQRIISKLVGKSFAYRAFEGGSPVDFRVGEQQIQSINKTTSANGTVTWVATWRSGAYGMRFIFDQWGENELGSEQIPLS